MWKSVVLLVLFILQLTSAEECSHTSPCTPLKGGQPFKNPTQIFSARQNNHVQLTVDIHEVTIDWLTVKRRLYNGEFPGPTIWIRPGEILNVEFVNNLKTPDPPKTDAGYGYPNTTNLHTHGLHISGMSPGDNPMYTVAPGDVYQYEFEVHPDQQPGTFWYHPHFHGSVFFQVLGGMKGALLVEDSPSSPPELMEVSCPFNCEHDLQIMFMLFQYTSGSSADYASVQRTIGDYEGFRQNGIQLDNSQQTLEDWLEDPANNIKYMLVNGLLNPVLEIQPGQMKRLRLLNSGEFYTLAVEIVNTNPGGPSCTVKEIA
uniref:Plastocyanin-like domain-containing protein n=1 Tax=Ciona savignyi TaxID=51511 RepID=H2YBB8_CIOSA